MAQVAALNPLQRCLLARAVASHALLEMLGVARLLALREKERRAAEATRGHERMKPEELDSLYVEERRLIESLEKENKQLKRKLRAAGITMGEDGVDLEISLDMMGMMGMMGKVGMIGMWGRGEVIEGMYK